VARSCVSAALALSLCAAAGPAFAQGNAAQVYTQATTREAGLRREIDTRKAGSPAVPLLRRVRILIGSYEDMARLFPRSGYSDNALYQGGMLAADAFWEFGEAADRTTAIGLLKALVSRYPSSSLVAEANKQVARLTAAAPPPASPAPASTGTAQTAAPVSHTSMLKAIRREVLPGALRVTLELDKEVAFYDERIEGPPRVFVDLPNTRSVDALKDATLDYAEDVVRHVRVGRQSATRTRVVLDLEGAGRHSVYALYDPFRIVIDVERPGATKDGKALAATKVTKPLVLATRRVPGATASPPRVASAGASAGAVIAPAATVAVVAPDAAEGRSIAPPRETATAGVRDIAPAAPRRNADGTLSLSRQLGLGIARIVIDPGHGGHDPGAQGKGIDEADLVLDVALRLEKLLLKQPGVEVVMTRRTDEFIPLEERTAMANREQADLFLSIHANASEDTRARGIETYFLNFAPNPQAEAIAARENAGSGRTMRSLPDIVKAIALNNKIDESRDFASLVQTAMVERLRSARRTPKNLGVKQAPFVVLIGANMPSVLAEISFVTNRQEQTWLKTQAYRQQLAEALLNGIMRYQKSLKGTQVAAATGTR
jgi:N-acetylmuramoyl-L-alanine amidase